MHASTVTINSNAVQGGLSKNLQNIARNILHKKYSQFIVGQKIVYIGVWQEISDSCAFETAIVQLYSYTAMGIIHA